VTQIGSTMSLRLSTRAVLRADIAEPWTRVSSKDAAGPNPRAVAASVHKAPWGVLATL
jgi:hypothetical protein